MRIVVYYVSVIFIAPKLNFYQSFLNIYFNLISLIFWSRPNSQSLKWQRLLFYIFCCFLAQVDKLLYCHESFFHWLLPHSLAAFFWLPVGVHHFFLKIILINFFVKSLWWLSGRSNPEYTNEASFVYSGTFN